MDNNIVFMESHESLWVDKSSNQLKKIANDESEDLIDVLIAQEKGIDSKMLDVNNFSVLWEWKDWEFVINEWNINLNEDGESYIIVDGIKYYEKWEYQYRYMKIFDDYWMTYFYIWEVGPDGLIDECKCVVLRYDGWIFKGEWNKKWLLKDPHHWEYDWAFVDWKPIDIHSKPEFRRKWVYTRADWSKDTFVAYSAKVRPQFVSWKDCKEKENWSKKRGSVVSVKTELPTWEVEHMLHSWKRDVYYKENEDSYIFESPNWKILKLPKTYDKWIDERYWKSWELRKGSDMAKQLANVINAIEKFICLHTVKGFTSFGSNLQVKYWDILIRKTLLKNVKHRFWVSAKEFAERLNDYNNEKL